MLEQLGSVLHVVLRVMVSRTAGVSGKSRAVMSDESYWANGGGHGVASRTTGANDNESCCGE